MNKQNYAKENFRLLEEKDVNNCKVRIFTRIKGIGEIPDKLKDYIYNMYHLYIMGDIPWIRSNCDMGDFDAVLAIHPNKDSVDVYVCGILRRPFTDKEVKEYEKYFLEDIEYRLSKVFDNHFKE